MTAAQRASTSGVNGYAAYAPASPTYRPLMPRNVPSAAVGDLDVADDLLRVEARGERFVAILDPLHRTPDDASTRQRPGSPRARDGTSGRTRRPRRARSPAAASRSDRWSGRGECGRDAGSASTSRSSAPASPASQLARVARPFERRGVEAAVMQALCEDAVGLGESLLDVAVLVLDVREAVRLRARRAGARPAPSDSRRPSAGEVARTRPRSSWSASSATYLGSRDRRTRPAHRRTAPGRSEAPGGCSRRRRRAGDRWQSPGCR